APAAPSQPVLEAKPPVAAAPAQQWPAPAPVKAPQVPAASAAAAAASSGAPAPAKSSAFGEDAGVDLAEMFGELKQDLESGTATADEDPETHYNLGIAFREMGLLDEA